MRGTVLGVGAGDTLVLATDGVRPTFAGHLLPGGTLQQVADGILVTHGIESDDALVLVVRYGGSNR